MADWDSDSADDQEPAAPLPLGLDCWDEVEKAVAEESGVLVARVAMAVVAGLGLVC